MVLIEVSDNPFKDGTVPGENGKSNTFIDVSTTPFMSQSISHSKLGYTVPLYREVLLRCDLSTLFTVKVSCPELLFIFDNYFWLEKCKIDGVTVPNKEWRKLLRKEGIDIDYEQIHRLRSFDEHHLDNGTICEPSVFGCSVERPPVGCEQREDIPSCFVTSYGWGEKIISVRLKDFGITEEIMDLVRPTITVSELHVARWDCGAKYEIHAQLLQSNELFGLGVRRQKEVQSVVKREYQQNSGSIWKEERVVFDSYPNGIRKIGLCTRGKDTQFWAGNYGIKFANLKITIKFPEIVELKALPIPSSSSSSPHSSPSSSPPLRSLHAGLGKLIGRRRNH